jgi:predicted  nucleic acid-binding Zn-ribbon protein
MSEYEERADDLEREADDMRRRTDRLEDEIEDVREDWERKKADSNVPGAAGDPERAEEGPRPETNYPSKGDED